MRVLVILLSIISCQSTTETLFTPPPHFLPNPNEFMTNESFTTPAPQTSSAASSAGSGSTRSRVIETKYGRLQGITLNLLASKGQGNGSSGSLKNKIVEVFLGIPYASPPIRFSPTQTPIPWEGVKDTDKPGFVCPQMLPDLRNDGEVLKEMPRGYLEYLRRIEPYLRNQSEDCLYLNIYSPIGPEPKLKPVLVFIHGGKFSWGSGTLYDGTVLSAYGDVVVVTLNYRLGVLGFLRTSNSGRIISNYGLMDQIAALHWIKENILAFGGNPENITLMGYEAGAACIHFLMSSPAVMPGLFHRSILIAGSSLAPWALVSDPAAAAASLAQALNCSAPANGTGLPTNSTAGLFAFNLTMPVTGFGQSSRLDSQQISSHQGKSYGPHNQDPLMECFKTKHFSHFAHFAPNKFAVDFGPTVDGVVIKPYFRINKDSMGKRDVTKKYDLLFGLSSLEKMTEFSETDLTFGFEGQRRDAILRTLIRNSYRFHLNEILATITNEYTDWERSVQHPVATRDLTLTAVTDCLALAPVIAASESSQINKAFFYVFDHATKDGLYNYQRSGAAGGEELSYIMGHPLIELVSGQVMPFIPTPIPSNFTKNEMALSELLITYVSNFAHTSDPNEPIKPDLNWPLSKERNRFRNNPWESYDRLHQKYLEISGTKIKTKTHYRAHQMAIWLRLVPELQRSGAHYASSLHNRMKGGNDPSLYVGSVRSGLMGEEDPAQLFDLGFDVEEAEGAGPAPGNPPAPPTTCFSPVFSAKNSSAPRGSGQGVPGSKERLNETAFDVSNLFSPYSTALSVTIAIGCSLLILNVFIFALVYYQRDKRRAQLLKESQSTESAQKYSEPPELLKSNSTPVQSNSMCSQTTQQQQQHFDCYSLASNSSQQQLGQGSVQHHRGILLSPQQAQAHSSNHHPHFAAQMLGVSTLPRSNGGLGMSTLPKPPPPPRGISSFSTLPHKGGGQHVCHSQLPGSNSSQKLTPFEILNV